MGAPFRVSSLRAPRPLHPLRYRIVLVILILFFIQQQRLFFIYRKALSMKYSPTVFECKFGRTASRLWRPADEDSQLQNELLASRESWQVLGSGWEGSTFIYNDVVIKTFTPGRSPFRNCALCQPGMKWPTEIPASLSFGNLLASDIVNTSFQGEQSSGFLPVKAYFLAAASPNSIPEWHLVTPLLREGNLEKLANKLHDNGRPKGFSALDIQYRPTFNRLLRTLEGMHLAGFCHDDIKPSNIFVQDGTHWVLGDLGNVRHISHPYHSSRIWSDNKQLHDCRANDVVRALKSYLQFLRSASNDTDAFDVAFLKGSGPPSALFWTTMVDSVSVTAEGLHARSAAQPVSTVRMLDALRLATLSTQRHSLSAFFLSKRHQLEKQVKQALRTSLSEDLARVLSLTWIVGVPESHC
ncbi:hypothetical protein K458DRAFT_393675 [Lentithecium fluviatile CBS 122367]|uniref:Uncharacterized protein n=1 Tax=Lentithecium fluviatile CBS 122367 TaxID=1168545 RepID=A0A6G1INI1_9PLEO|nr:hypothetical protein K458DRAFT_393675 [Lentithecium fluviatile CBS 122367]